MSFQVMRWPMSLFSGFGCNACRSFCFYISSMCPTASCMPAKCVGKHDAALSAHGCHAGARLSLTTGDPPRFMARHHLVPLLADKGTHQGLALAAWPAAMLLQMLLPNHAVCWRHF